MPSVSPSPSPRRQSRLGPTLLILCGALSLYLLAVAHFVFSCLDQIHQAIETTRHSYLPEVVRQHQDARSIERLHRFATIVRHAADPETRRQAALHVQVMALNASPARALDNRPQLRQAAVLVERLIDLRRRHEERLQYRSSQLACLAHVREHLPAGSEPRSRADALLAGDPNLTDGQGWQPPPPAEFAAWLDAAEENQRELRSVEAEIELVWQQCESILDNIAETIGTGACLSLDRLVGSLTEQVRSLQRLAAWLLSFTLVLVLGLGFLVHRNLVQPILACARAIRTGDAGALPEAITFREIQEVVANLRTGAAKPDPATPENP